MKPQNDDIIDNRSGNPNEVYAGKSDDRSLNSNNQNNKLEVTQLTLAQQLADSKSLNLSSDKLISSSSELKNFGNQSNGFQGARYEVYKGKNRADDAVRGLGFDRIVDYIVIF